MITLAISGNELQQLIEITDKDLSHLKDVLFNSSKEDEPACLKCLFAVRTRRDQLQSFYRLYQKDKANEQQKQ